MFETMTKANKLDKAKELFIDAVDADMEWQREAMEDFDFRDGNQWTKKEREVLEKELRPALTFNMTKSSVDLIMGLNEDNRIIFRCTPQERSDDFLCEVMNTIYDWVRENNEFEDEEDMALESAAIAGRGYVALDFVPDPKRFGDITMQEVVVPVHEVHFDPAARRTDLSDASYITWDRWLSVEEFAVKFPKYSAKRVQEFIETGRSYVMGSAAPGEQDIFDKTSESRSDSSDYSRPLDTTYYDRGRRMVRLVHMEYWETFKRYFGLNPETNGYEEFEPKNLSNIKKVFAEKYKMTFQYETLMDKRVKWLQFIGDEILFDDISPLPFDGFSIVPMFAFRDVSQRSANHFGIVRLMKDPQREINKRWSQALNLLNQSSQPGVFVEVDAFLDLEQALLSMKDPGSATLLNSGGMNKFKERTMPAFPAAPMQMEEYSQEIMRKITGINPDLLGQDRGRQEPGVVVRLRQQQGMVLMKPLFKSFNKLRKGLFRRSLAIIMEYMPNEQIMKILGENGRYQMDDQGNIADQDSGLQANLRDLKNVEYNIKSEEAPGNMTKRTLELTSFLEMQKSGFPVEPSVVIERLDLPASEKKKWMEFIDGQQKGQQEMAEKQMAQEQANKDRELSVDEKRLIMEFIIDSAKINQQAEKDEKKLATSAAQVEQSSNAAILSFLASIMKPEGGSSDGESKERKASTQGSKAKSV